MTIPFVVSAASLCIVVFSFFYFRRYIARKTAARELLADYRAEVYRLIAEIDAAADRDSLLVEERIKTLKKLIDDTDRRIGVYMRELQRSRTGEAMYASLGRGIRAALDSRVPEPPPPAPQPELFAPPALVKADAPQEQKAPPPAQDAPQPDAPAASGKRGGKKPKVKVQIAEMAALGVPPPKIASRLKLSIAEVELALNLLHRNNA